MDIKIFYENPLKTLNDDYMAIVKDVVIKYRNLAIVQEDLEMTKYVNQYMDAYFKKDVFESYTYDSSDFTAVGVSDPNEIRDYLADSDDIPNGIKESLVELKRNKTLNEYVEKNEYYRMLNGLPKLDDKEFVYLPYDRCVELGINATDPIHNIRKVNGDHIIDLIEARGWLDDLIKENPDKEYLKYIGKKNIDPVFARRAASYDLLYLPKISSEDLRDKFIIIYNQCRDYFVKTIYTPQMSKMIDYYDNFVGLCIMVMTLQQLTVRSIQYSIDRDFFNMDQIKALFDTYDVPYFDSLDIDTQKAICNNINIMIRDKGTNKIIYDIARILGFDDIKIYKYYLMKSHILSEEGYPAFSTISQYDESTGQDVITYDYQSMYDVYFQKVDVRNYDMHDALNDPNMRETYTSVTSGDPYWVVDDDLLRELYESEYNYKESKYLGLSISYKLTDILYEFILLFREICSNKDLLNDILIDLPSVSTTQKFNVFDSIVFLAALLSKKYGLKGEIVSKSSQVYAVLDANEYVANPQDGKNDTFGFNFDFFNSIDYQRRKDEVVQYMTPEEQREFEGYILTLTLDTSSNSQKILTFNKMYNNTKKLSTFLINMMSKTNSLEAYETFRRMYNTIFYVKETSKMFTTYSGVVPTTYAEYLRDTQPLLYNKLTETSREDIHLMIAHVIDRIDNVIDGLKNIQVVNNATSKLHDVLIALIRFFKSYTTDMIGLNIVYTLDFKMDMLFRFFDMVDNIVKINGINEYLNFGYNDAITSALIKINLLDNNIWRDSLFTHVESNLRSDIIFHDICKQINSYFISDKIFSRDEYKYTVIPYINDNFKIGFKEYIKSELEGHLYERHFSIRDRLDNSTTIINITDGGILNDFITSVNKRLGINDNRGLLFRDVVYKV